MEETIYSGWLTKSPPDKFVQILRRTPFTVNQKLIKAKWRRRYFVLYKPGASLPGEYSLDYYIDEKRRRRKGEISLGECDNIQSSLESSYYQHLFSLQTKQKGVKRLYYLAADSEADMAKWVHCLSNVCGLNPEPVASSSSEVAPPQLAHVARAIDLPEASAMPPPPPIRIDSMPSNEYTQEPVPATVTRRTADPTTSLELTSHDPESYILLDECSTGVTNINFDDRSMTPIRESYSSRLPSTYYDQHSTGTDSLDGDIYDTPPRDGSKITSEPEINGSYQVPPVRTHSRCIRSATLQQEQHPGASGGVAGCQGAWHRSSDVDSNRDSDLADYDVLTPSPSGPRPVRPPKPPSVMLRTGDGDQTAAHRTSTKLMHGYGAPPDGYGDTGWDDGNDTYDLPRTVSTTIDFHQLPASPPPPCDGGGDSSGDMVVHKYVNAGLAVVHMPPAERASNIPDVGCGDEDADDVYSIPPPPVGIDDFRRSQLSTLTAVGGESAYNCPLSLAAGPAQPQPKRCTSLNPTAPRGAPQPGRPYKPRQLRDSHVGVSGSSAEGTYAPSPTRVSVTYTKQLSAPMPPLADPIPLPTKTGTGTDGSDSSNDDDYDVDSDSSNNDAEGSAIYQAPRSAPIAAQKPGVATGPPPPYPGIVEYLDIAHDAGSENHSPLPSRSASFGNQSGIGSAGGGSSSATEYTDIDRVKTKALETTKKDLEATKKDLEARKGSEKD